MDITTYMNKKIILFFILLIFILAGTDNKLFSQGMGIGPSTFTPNANAILELQGSGKGLLVPSWASTSRPVSPPTGLMYYQTDAPAGYYYYNGSSWVQLTAATVGVGSGGTGLTSGTSGGILGFTASGTLASSALLTANAVVIGGGAGATPSTLALGTANQVLGMNAAGTANVYTTLGGAASITANQTATNATTVLTGASWTMPANTATVGMVIRIRCNYRFVKTAGPPTLTCNLRVGGALAASFVISSVSSATTSGGYIEGNVTLITTGAGGTYMSSMDGSNNHGITNATNWNPQFVNIATSAINTTIANTISLTMNMTTAVAANTLTISQGWVEVVKP